MEHPTLKDRVLAAARERPAPRRSQRRWYGAAAAPLAAAAMVGVLFLWGGPDDAAGRPAAVGAWMVIGLAVLAVVVTRLALPPRGSMLPPPAGRLLAAAVGVPVVVAAWLIAWHAAYDDPFTRLGLRCFALTVAAAPWPFAALLAATPRLDPSHPWLTGGALGAAAGAWAAVVVELWCPLADPGHVAVGHALPLVALVAAGALVGARVLKLRPV